MGIAVTSGLGELFKGIAAGKQQRLRSDALKLEMRLAEEASDRDAADRQFLALQGQQGIERQIEGVRRSQRGSEKAIDKTLGPIAGFGAIQGLEELSERTQKNWGQLSDLLPRMSKEGQLAFLDDLQQRTNLEMAEKEAGNLLEAIQFSMQNASIDEKQGAEFMGILQELSPDTIMREGPKLWKGLMDARQESAKRKGKARQWAAAGAKISSWLGVDAERAEPPFGFTVTPQSQSAAEAEWDWIQENMDVEDAVKAQRRIWETLYVRDDDVWEFPPDPRDEELPLPPHMYESKAHQAEVEQASLDRLRGLAPAQEAPETEGVKRGPRGKLVTAKQLEKRSPEDFERILDRLADAYFLGGSAEMLAVLEEEQMDPSSFAGEEMMNRIKERAKERSKLDWEGARKIHHRGNPAPAASGGIPGLP